MPYKALGFFFVGLGALGVFLPLLPTTPFLLLAAGCFARSSEKWHAWLRDSRLFGPILRDWEARRCIPRGARNFSLISMIGLGGYSIVFVVGDWRLQLLGLVLVIIGSVVVCRLQVCDH